MLRAPFMVIIKHACTHSGSLIYFFLFLLQRRQSNAKQKQNRKVLKPLLLKRVNKSRRQKAHKFRFQKLYDAHILKLFNSYKSGTQARKDASHFISKKIETMKMLVYSCIKELGSYRMSYSRKLRAARPSGKRKLFFSRRYF